jgi:hypothetical protein
MKRSHRYQFFRTFMIICLVTIGRRISPWVTSSIYSSCSLFPLCFCWKPEVFTCFTRKPFTKCLCIVPGYPDYRISIIF